MTEAKAPEYAYRFQYADKSAFEVMPDGRLFLTWPNGRREEKHGVVDNRIPLLIGMAAKPRQDKIEQLEAQLHQCSAASAEAPDDDDNTMRDDPMFNRGVDHVVDLLAKTLAPLGHWHAGDGSEDYDCDLEETLRNILAAKGLYDPGSGEFAAAVRNEPQTASEDWKQKYETEHARLVHLNGKYDNALKAGASEEPTDEGIAEAIRQTEYKYFGDYELSDCQWDAIFLLVNAAKHLIKRRSQATTEPPAASPAPLDAAKKLLISASIGSCTCNTKSPELMWHAPDCRFVTIMMALENVEIAASRCQAGSEPSIDAVHDTIATALRCELTFSSVRKAAHAVIALTRPERPTPTPASPDASAPVLPPLG